MKYIDADLLKERLDTKYKEFVEKAKKDCPLQYQYMADGLDIAEQFVDSLQQEQPKMKLEEETIRIEFRTIGTKCFNEGIEGWDREKLIARHFYELGLRRAAEMYDEIEYNRQRAEEE